MPYNIKYSSSKLGEIPPKVERNEMRTKWTWTKTKSVSTTKWIGPVASCNFWQDISFFLSKIVNVGASFAVKDNK